MLEVESSSSQVDHHQTDQSDQAAATAAKRSIKEQILQSQKDRTLFCVNIDQKCTEEILFELFYQAGPIENLVRKADRNGKLICLVTYKHLESCDYAIKVFNNIQLYNQPLRVQFSQNSSQNQQQQQQQQQQQNSSGSRLPRNNSSTQGLNSRNQSQTRQQDYTLQHQQQQAMFIAGPLMNIMMSQMRGGAHQQLPFMPPHQQQQAPNAFHRSRSGPNIIDDYDHQDQSSNRYNNNNSHQQRMNTSANHPSSHHHQHQHQSRHSGSSNLGSWSNVRTRDMPPPQPQSQQHQQQHYSRDRGRGSDGGGAGGGSGGRRSRSRSPNSSNKRFRR